MIDRRNEPVQMACQILPPIPIHLSPGSHPYCSSTCTVDQKACILPHPRSITHANLNRVSYYNISSWNCLHCRGFGYFPPGIGVSTSHESSLLSHPRYSLPVWLFVLRCSTPRLITTRIRYQREVIRHSQADDDVCTHRLLHQFELLT